MSRNLAGGILSTDSYQLTMAQLYWRAGLAERPARRALLPFVPRLRHIKRAIASAAGLGPFASWMTTTRHGRRRRGAAWLPQPRR